MVSYVLCTIFFGFAANAIPVTPWGLNKNFSRKIDGETLEVIQSKAKLIAGLKSREDVEGLLLQEMLDNYLSKRRLESQRNAANARSRNLMDRIKTLENEKTKLEEDKSIVLAGTLIEKLGHEYGGKLESATRREEWLYILENRKEGPVRFIKKKIEEAGLTNQEFVQIILEICVHRNHEIHYKMLERSFKKIKLKFRGDAPTCLLWCAEVLLGAYAMLKVPTTTSTATTIKTAIN